MSDTSATITDINAVRKFIAEQFSAPQDKPAQVLPIRDTEPAPNPQDESLERLVAMTSQTCQVALDKTLSAIHRYTYGNQSAHAAAAKCSNIGERVNRAEREIGECVKVRKIITPTEGV